MKLPAKVMISGVEYKVKTSANYAGGSFSGVSNEIEVGAKFPNDVSMIFLHEVMEAILTERNHRYKIYEQPTNEKLLFSFDHAEWVNIVKDIAHALKGIKF